MQTAAQTLTLYVVKHCIMSKMRNTDARVRYLSQQYDHHNKAFFCRSSIVEIFQISILYEKLILDVSDNDEQLRWRAANEQIQWILCAVVHLNAIYRLLRIC